jgi:hypothetical protein
MPLGTRFDRQSGKAPVEPWGEPPGVLAEEFEGGGELFCFPRTFLVAVTRLYADPCIRGSP